MYDELVKRLRDRAGAFDYDGRPDIACDYEQAADVIEKLSAYAEFYKDLAEKNQQMARKRIEDTPRWISVEGRLPSDFVSVQAHRTDAGNFPPVREAYVVNKIWFFPALKEFHPVDMWKRFDEPPKEE